MVKAFSLKVGRTIKIFDSGNSPCKEVVRPGMVDKLNCSTVVNSGSKIPSLKWLKEFRLYVMGDAPVIGIHVVWLRLTCKVAGLSELVFIVTLLIKYFAFAS